jgi:Ni,Fe-hydrogenase maturation factor
VKKTLLIAIGNPLRGDDGIAHVLLSRLGTSEAIDHRFVHQLTPELSAEISAYASVLFLDADISARDLTIEPVRESGPCSVRSHLVTPGEVVSLSRELYGFSGCARICRIPASNFEYQDENS